MEEHELLEVGGRDACGFANSGYVDLELVETVAQPGLVGVGQRSLLHR